MGVTINKNTTMIDPTKVTNFKRNVCEMEEFLLFSIVVAGKGAFQQATKLQQFLDAGRAVYGKDATPFELVRALDTVGLLEDYLRSVKMGQYTRITSAFRGIAHLAHAFGHYPLYRVPVNLLECIKGIGMKTARFFIMHTRPDQKLACLDTHILRWLGEKGHEVPKTTPNGPKYLALEQIFLGYAEQMGKSPADLDLEIWNSNHPEKVSTK